MKKVYWITTIAITVLSVCCKEQKKETRQHLVIGKGRMPALTKDDAGNFYVVYGTGDSIMYAASTDEGATFSTPGLVAVLPKLVASSMRGPQIASTASGVAVIACNKSGDIFFYTKDKTDRWLLNAKLNDVDTVAKEGLMALGADGKTVIAVWLDVRDGHNKIVGTISTDAGKTWTTNKLIYASPDASVCECCKPAVVVQGQKVYVMFRNWLKGNRDLYVVQSTDGGKSFGEAQKLGITSWALNGCPMDGGGLVISDEGTLETVWRRKDSIYACQAGKPETFIGLGKSCTMEKAGGKNMYAWTTNGEVIIHKAQGMEIKLGKGQLPAIKSSNNKHLVCVWENEKQIQVATVVL